MNNENEFLDWNGSFIAEESTFTLLPAGEYPFVVVGFERKIYDGNSDKIQNGTPFAEIEMEFTGAEGTTKVFDRLYMVKKWQWKLTQFFTSIGQSPIIGQPFSPNWSAVVGSQGRAKLEINKYTNRNTGKEVKNNQIDEYLAPIANTGFVSQGNTTQTQQNFGQQSNFNQQPMQNNQPQQGFNQSQQPQAGGFQPGAF